MPYTHGVGGSSPLTPTTFSLASWGKMMKIAITGANGFVGSNLANYFQGRGDDFVALTRAGADTSLLAPNIPILNVDYTSPSSLASALTGVEVLIHNAGKTRTLTFSEMLKANVGTTRRVLDAFNATPTCQHFIYISSLAASRPSKDNQAICEDDSSAPVDWYGRSKVLAERIIRAECAKDWTIVRPVSVYGVGDADFLLLFKALKSGLSLRIGKTEQHYNLIHIRQLCEFIGACTNHPAARNQLFFASDGEVYSHSRFISLAAKQLGAKTRELAIPAWLAILVGKVGDLWERVTQRSTMVNSQKLKEVIGVNWLCSIEKARHLLDWKPLPNLEADLRDTLAWYKDKGWL